MRTLSLAQFKHLSPCDPYIKDNYKYAKQLLNGREYLSPCEIRELEISLDDKLWVLLRMLSGREALHFVVVKIHEHYSTYSSYFSDIDNKICEIVNNIVCKASDIELKNIENLTVPIKCTLYARAYRKMIPFNKYVFGSYFLKALNDMCFLCQIDSYFICDEISKLGININESQWEKDMVDLYYRMCKLNYIDEIITILNEGQ